MSSSIAAAFRKQLNSALSTRDPNKSARVIRRARDVSRMHMPMSIFELRVGRGENDTSPTSSGTNTANSSSTSPDVTASTSDNREIDKQLLGHVLTPDFVRKYSTGVLTEGIRSKIGELVIISKSGQMHVKDTPEFQSMIGTIPEVNEYWEQVSEMNNDAITQIKQQFAADLAEMNDLKKRVQERLAYFEHVATATEQGANRIFGEFDKDPIGALTTVQTMDLGPEKSIHTNILNELRFAILVNFIPVLILEEMTARDTESISQFKSKIMTIVSKLRSEFKKSTSRFREVLAQVRKQLKSADTLESPTILGGAGEDIYFGEVMPAISRINVYNPEFKVLKSKTGHIDILPDLSVRINNTGETSIEDLATKLQGQTSTFDELYKNTVASIEVLEKSIKPAKFPTVPPPLSLATTSRTLTQGNTIAISSPTSTPPGSPTISKLPNTPENNAAIQAIRHNALRVIHSIYTVSILLLEDVKEMTKLRNVIKDLEARIKEFEDIVKNRDAIINELFNINDELTK